MKRIIIAVLFLLLVSPAFAMFGGETINYTFDKCSYLTISITPCEANEWTVKNCVQESIGNWHCECNDNYVLYLTPAVNALGTYELSITNYYQDNSMVQQVQIFSPIYSSGGYVPPNGNCQIDGCSPGYECIVNKTTKWGKCLKIENAPIVNNTVTNITIVQPVNITDNMITNNTTPTPSNPQPDYIIMGAFLISVILLIAALIITFRRHKKGKPIETPIIKEEKISE